MQGCQIILSLNIVDHEITSHPTYTPYFFLETFSDIAHRLGGITPLDVFSDAFPGHKMQEHLRTVPDIHVIWAVTLF
jgi:hypothetical protein